MKIDRVPHLIRVAYAADLPLLLRGRHGIGKSTILEQVAEELGIGCQVLDLSLMEAVDLLGLPQINDGRVAYAPPAVLPVDGRGLLLLEELNRAPAMTRTPALELLTRRRLHEYVLPPGWLPCASVNPAADGYAVDVLDRALESRFVVVDVEPDRESWLIWAATRGLHPGLLAYVSAATDLFEADSVNPRSLEYASRLMQSVEASALGETERRDVLASGLSGLLGDTVAIGVLRFMTESTTPLKAEDVLGEYEAFRPTVLRWIDDGRLDVVDSTSRNVRRALERQRAWDAVKADAQRAGNLEQFVHDLPPDLRMAFDSWRANRGYDERRRKAR